MTDKKTCFVIMPFDPPYKEQCERIYEPAIKAAGLKPHLAGGPGADIITEEIENGIRNACVCFADISEDNPNVWYELGFAYACSKQVVIVCDKEKRPGKLPFDISVKKVIFYKGATVLMDYNPKGLQVEITENATEKAARAAAPVADNRSSAHASDTDMPKLTGLDIKVLGAIVRICSDGKTAAFPLPIMRELKRVGVSPLPQRLELQETIEALTHYGLIVKVGKYDKMIIAHQPTLKGKKCHLDNRA